MVQCYMQTKNVRTVHQVLFTISAHRFLSVANLARSSRERSCGQSAFKDPAGTASLPITYAKSALRSRRSGGSRRM